MEHQAKFRRFVLPHYLKVTTSVLTLNAIASCSDGQDLSPEEESRLRSAVETAHRETQEAVGEGKEILEAVDREIRDAKQEKRGVEEEVMCEREQLLKMGNEVVSQERMQEQLRDALRGYQLQIQQAEDTIVRENARKAAKKTLRDLGFGLLLLPFAGIPLAIGASREMCRCQAEIDSASEKKAAEEVKRDQSSVELEQCLEKLETLRHRRLAVEGSLREKERALLPLHEEMNQLLTARRKVFDDLQHLTSLETRLDVVAGRCAQDPFPGIDLVRKGLCQLVSLVQSQSLSFELLGEPRVLSMLGRLDSTGQD